VPGRVEKNLLHLKGPMFIGVMLIPSHGGNASQSSRGLFLGPSAAAKGDDLGIENLKKKKKEEPGGKTLREGAQRPAISQRLARRRGISLLTVKGGILGKEHAIKKDCQGRYENIQTF